MSDKPSIEKVHGYEIKRSVVFENDRGFAFAENPNAPQPFVTWQLTENENGKRDYYWGHYFDDFDKAAKDFEFRVANYQQSYGITEKVIPAPGVYKYYSTQRPVDLGTFPKTENGPVKIVNFNNRESVEHGQLRAWGYLLFCMPLSEKQVDDYELRGAPGNPTQLQLTPEQLEQQVQTVGKWEQVRRIPDGKRLTWWYPDFGSYVKKEFVTEAELSGRYKKIMDSKARTAQKGAVTKPIAKQLKEGTAQVERDNATRPAPTKNGEKER